MPFTCHRIFSTRGDEDALNQFHILATGDLPSKSSGRHDRGDENDFVHAMQVDLILCQQELSGDGWRSFRWCYIKNQFVSLGSVNSFIPSSRVCQTSWDPVRIGIKTVCPLCCVTRSTVCSWEECDPADGQIRKQYLETFEREAPLSHIPPSSLLPLSFSHISTGAHAK